MKFLFSLFLFFILSNHSFAVTKQKRFGDRRYIENVLLEIYGKGIKGLLEKKVWNEPKIFGFPCDAYEVVVVKSKEDEDSGEVLEKRSKCGAEFVNSTAPMIAEDSKIRQHAMKNLCHEASEHIEGLDRKFGPEEIRKVYKKFYPTSAVSNEKIEDLASSFRFLSRKKKWKNLYFGLCNSEGWQVL